MTYERKQIESTPSRPVKRSRKGSGLIRAIRRIKPSPAYLQGMHEWSDRAVKELSQTVVEIGGGPCLLTQTDGPGLTRNAYTTPTRKTIKQKPGTMTGLSA